VAATSEDTGLPQYRVMMWLRAGYSKPCRWHRANPNDGYRTKSRTRSRTWNVTIGSGTAWITAIAIQDPASFLYTGEGPSRDPNVQDVTERRWRQD